MSMVVNFLYALGAAFVTIYMIAVLLRPEKF